MSRFLNKSKYLLRLSCWVTMAMLFLLCSRVGMTAVVITTATGGTTLCNSYVTLGNIVITEGANTDIPVMTVSKTLILTVPTGYEFNPGVGSAAFSGSSPGSADLTVIAIVVSSTKITLTITTDASAGKSDVITISGIQVKASALDPEAASGSIMRIAADPGTAGAFVGITNDVTNFGTLTQTNMEYTSSSVIQSNTNNVAQNTNDNEILRIEVVMTNSCDALNATLFSLNTTGTSDPTDGITTAKIYYTGTSSTFATTTLFGSRASPNGAYIIAGSATLSEGTNYFWLTYDVPVTATSTTLLDAECTAITIDGTGQSTPTVEPYAGSRTVGITNINSNGTGGGNWNLTTSWAGGVVPTASNHVTILNGDVISNTDVQSAVDITVNGGASGGQLNISTGTLTIWGNLTVTSPGTMTSTSSSNLVINNLGGKAQLSVPAGVVNIKKITINRNTGVWSDHDIRLDQADVTPAGTSVLVLTNGILMMNTASNGSGTVKTLYMNDLDVERDIACSNSSHVDGIVSRFIPNDGLFYFFPIGNGGVSRKLALSANSISSNNENTGRFIYSTHPNYLDFNPATLPGGVIDKYWWQHTRVASQNVARRFYFDETVDFPVGTDLNDLSIASYTGATWTAATTPTTLNAGSRYVEQNGPNASNDIPWSWGSTDANSPLPVTLTDFITKISDQNTVKLSWNTQGESECDYFAIQRSKNAVDFEEIGRVKGNGTSLSKIEYSFFDESPNSGLGYYRLKQMDFDGNFILSDVKAVYIEPKSFEVNKIFPNPAGGNAFIDIYSESEKDLTIKVVNNMGVVVKEIPHQTEKGSNLVEVDLNDLGGGIYFMQVSEGASKKKATMDKIILK